MRTAAYAWAAPNTLIGLLAGLALVARGGRFGIVAGVVEFHRAAGAGPAHWLPTRCRFDAITLGHVILGRSEESLAALRGHEQAHVRQYERWGPFFLPAYAASSAWQWLHGGRPHHDNRFERQARTEAP